MPILFSDDSNLFQHGKNLEDIIMKINSELTEIAEWLKVNKLTLNINKTLCMLFSKKHNHADISIKLEGKLINRVSETKLMGVIIDDKLNWKAHISYISGTISRAIGVIIKARNLWKEALLPLNYTLIFPYNQVWVLNFKYNLNALRKLQKRFYEAIFSYGGFIQRIRTFESFWNLSLSRGPIYDRYHRKMLPKFFSCIFIKHSATHQYRQSDLYLLPGYNKDFGRRSILFLGVKIWVAIILAKIDLDTSQPVFKRNLRRCLLQGMINRIFLTNLQAWFHHWQ